MACFALTRPSEAAQQGRGAVFDLGGAVLPLGLSLVARFAQPRLGLCRLLRHELVKVWTGEGRARRGQRGVSARRAWGGRCGWILEVVVVVCCLQDMRRLLWISPAAPHTWHALSATAELSTSSAGATLLLC